jgi:hypothetical protein
MNVNFKLLFDNIRKEKPLGLPVPKLESKIQASGEATYSDDVAARNRNTLFGAYVVSSIPAGKIKYELYSRYLF